MDVAASRPSMVTGLPPSLLSSFPPSVSAARHAAARAESATWRCSLGCGKQYERSSGRSIRRHLTACFRSHWPGGSTLTDSELQALMSAQQESGHLVTGLRRWKMRQSTRTTLEFSDGDKWACPTGCGQLYRLSSTCSIQRHTNTCKPRPVQSIEAGGCSSDGFVNSSPAVAGSGGRRGEEKPTAGASECRLEPPVALRWIPAQFDGFEDGLRLGQDMDESDDALLDGSSSLAYNSPSRTPFLSSLTDTPDWENTRLRALLRRQLLETEHLTARHCMQIIALRDKCSNPWHESLPRG